MDFRFRSACFSLVVVFFLFVSSLTIAADGFPRTVRDVEGRRVTIDTAPQRIFSGGLNVGSTLLKLLPSERVVALGQFADDPAYSFVADTASDLPSYQQVRAETVLKHDPDLVILTKYTRADIRRQILDFDVPVILTGTVNTKEDILRNTRLIARTVGETDRAETWLNRMNDVLDHPSNRPSGPNVLYYTMSGTVSGDETLPDLILRSAGLENTAARAGIQGWKVMSPEKILESPPEWFIFEDRNRDQIVQKLRDDSALSSLEAVEKDRFRSAQPKYLTVASPYVYKAVEYWRDQFEEIGHDTK